MMVQQIHLKIYVSSIRKKEGKDRMDSFYEKDELAELGLKSYGEDVLISRKASIYSAKCIEIGSHVRIDDFCILSGRITIEDYIHISAGVYLFGGDIGITFRHHSSIASQSLVYAITDDYSGEYLTNSTVAAKYRHILSAPVTVEPYCVIGAGTIILPGASLGEGCAVGQGALLQKA